MYTKNGTDKGDSENSSKDSRYSQSSSSTCKMANAQQDTEIDMEALNQGSETTFDTSSVVEFPPLPSPSRVAADNRQKGTTRKTSTTEIEVDPPQQTASTNEEHQTGASTMEATRNKEMAPTTNPARAISDNTRNHNQGKGTTNPIRPAYICQQRATHHPPSRPLINPCITRPPNDKNTDDQNHCPTLDKAIALKRGDTRLHIHQYDLRIKVKACQTEEGEFRCVQQCLQKFFDIVPQTDNSSTIPPYFELNRADRTVPDINSAYLILALDSLESIKRYFSRLSQRNDKGNLYYSLILAQNVSFTEFMGKARSSLMNLDNGIFPKACDHERTAKIGLLLYSTR